MDVAVKADSKAKPDARPLPTIKKVGVIGAGQMGSGIAHVIALGKYDVSINDIRKEAVDKALATIEKNMGRQVAKGLVKEADMKAALTRIAVRAKRRSPQRLRHGHRGGRPRTRPSSARSSKGFVRILKPSALLATNTSSISITRLASTTDRPEHFIGMHFLNPVPLMELVELIRGIATEDEVFAVARTFVESLGEGHGGLGRFSGLHRQPHPAADDQRSRLHAL